MRKKKVGFFIPYLNTKGGGEKVVVVMAEHLAGNYNVELILRKNNVTIEELEQYFNVNLKNVKLKIFGEKSKFTKIITSPRSPVPERMKILLHAAIDYRAIKKQNYDIFINSNYQSNMRGAGKKNIYMCMFPHKLTHEFSKKNLARKIYESVLLILEKTLKLSGKTAYGTYDLITANSEYTKTWIKKRWELDSEVLYPIAEDMGPPAEKIPMILHVGRFFANSYDAHHKRQDILLEAFKSMKSLHKKGWELHLAGTVADNPDAMEFVINLIHDADGYPVYFHLNSNFKRLRELFRQTSVYWHATGFGFDHEKYPEKQEHFGITTVESMSAGAVPIVINSAGQKETVKQGQNGYLWDTIKQLKQFTQRIAKNPDTATKLRAQAIKDSNQYDREHFIKRLDEIFAKLEQQ